MRKQSIDKAIREKWWIKYIIATSILVTSTLLLSWWFGGFTATDQNGLLEAWGLACFLSGIVTTLYGLELVLKYGNVLGRIINGIIKLFQWLKQDSVDHKYRNFYGYNKIMREKRYKFWYIVLGGALCVAIGIILTYLQQI